MNVRGIMVIAAIFVVILMAHISAAVTVDMNSNMMLKDV